MRWWKVAAVAFGLLAVYLVIGAVIGVIIELAIFAAVVGVGVLGIRMALRHRRLSSGPRTDDHEVRDTYTRRLPATNPGDVEDELTRLRREMREMGS